MYIFLDSNNKVREIIPDFDATFPGIPIEQRFSKEFIDNLIHVDDNTIVKQHWIFDNDSKTFIEP